MRSARGAGNAANAGDAVPGKAKVEKLVRIPELRVIDYGSRQQNTSVESVALTAHSDGTETQVLTPTGDRSCVSRHTMTRRVRLRKLSTTMYCHQKECNVRA